MTIGNVFVGVIVLATSVVKCEPEAQKKIMPIMINNYWHASPSSTAKDLVALLMPLITLNQKRLALLSSQHMPVSTPTMAKGQASSKTVDCSVIRIDCSRPNNFPECCDIKETGLYEGGKRLCIQRNMECR